MPFSTQELTNTGLKYLSESQLNPIDLKFDKIVVGSGVAANIPNDLWPLTALIQWKLDVAITSYVYVDPNTVKVVGSLSSINVPPGGGFNLNEVGIIAETSAPDPALLYSVCNTGGGGDFIPDQNSTAPITQTLEIYLRVDRVQSVIFNVVPGGITYDAANKGLATVGPGPYISQQANVFYFKRFRAGNGISIGDTDGGDTITIGNTQPLATPADGANRGPSSRGPGPFIITQSGVLQFTRFVAGAGLQITSTDGGDSITFGMKAMAPGVTTLYVATNGNDATAQPNNPAMPWATLQGAHDWLLPYAIPTNSNVNIDVAAGTYNSSTQITISHPNGDRINILGKLGNSNTIASLVSHSGSPGNYVAVLKLSTGAIVDFGVGDWVRIYQYWDTGSQGQYWLNGVFEVVGVSGLSISIKIVNEHPWPNMGNLATGQTMQAHKVVFNVTATRIVGIYFTCAKIGLCRDILVKRNLMGPGGGIECNRAILTNCSVVLFNATNTITASGFSLDDYTECYNCYASRNGTGFGLSSPCWLQDCVSSYNDAYGFQLGGGQTFLENCYAIDNGGAGVLAGTTSVAILNETTIAENDGSGCNSGTGAVITLEVNASAYVFKNTPYDFQVQQWSQIVRGPGAGWTYGTASQAINQVTTSGIIAP